MMQVSLILNMRQPSFSVAGYSAWAEGVNNIPGGGTKSVPAARCQPVRLATNHIYQCEIDVQKG
jgi:hypothetical protein